MKFNTKSLFVSLAFGVFALVGFQLVQAQYCLPVYGNQCTSDDYINQVTFAGINQLGSGCGTPALLGGSILWQ